uniref:Peptidase A2 domain-containing protein n=1 Tax=Caenorhabditis japonica TaxID=281687 RepID=A0A8R1HWM7_CAEJA
MIHVEVKINKQQVTCLVDTGAQLSIISKNAAERCGILNLLDTRFKVDAAGVGGVRNALGKILQVEFEFPGYLMPVVLTVFECGLVNDAEVIIGVDVLTAYNANIDFKNQCVLFNDEVRVKMVKRE